MSAKRELAGLKFGYLLVLEETKFPKKSRTFIWKCLCDCGNITYVAGNHLKTGEIKSCGCYRRKHASIIGKRYGGRSKLPYGEASFYSLYLRYMRNAKKRGLSFDLPDKLFRILVKGDCFYCGKSPQQVERSLHANGDYIYNGIDRIDNTQGYSESNCVSCCKGCNISKGTMSEQEFIEHIRRIYFHTINDLFLDES